MYRKFPDHVFVNILCKLCHFLNYKGIEDNTNFGQITGVQEKLDTTCK